MLDVILLALGVGFFALAVGYTRLQSSLRRSPWFSIIGSPAS